MNRVIGLCVVSESAQAFSNHFLQVGLPLVDHVVHGGSAAEMRRVASGLAGCRGPEHAAIRLSFECAIPEIEPEQAEFPELICDVFADISDNTVGSNDDFVRVLHVL